MYKGKVESVFEKGFGFILIEGQTKKIFFHASQVNGPFGTFNSIKPGMEVEVEEIEKAEKGDVAKGITVLY